MAEVSPKPVAVLAPVPGAVPAAKEPEMAKPEMAATANTAVNVNVIVDVEDKPAKPDKSEKSSKKKKPTKEPEPEPEEDLTDVPNPKDLQVTKKQIKAVMDCIEELLGDHKFSAGLMVRVVANCMMLTAKLKTTPATRKKIVCEGIEAFIRSSKSGLNEDETQALMAIVDVSVSEAFDTLTEVHQGMIKVAPGNCCVIC
jgi:hypothetical protein